MSESESEPGGIRDEDLPEDLQPGEDNPLAEPLADDVDPDELDLEGGKTAEESEDEADDAGDSGDTGSDSHDDGASAAGGTDD
ncbi:hypothetical protein [Nocardioides coralli]|uniref:hypothetical protein n=1 Tax=Nocardioides coralli TaxID=2872154 RepID=UPI001CA46034|nr:hypothetical protein [Nocardioides coralli]QZY30260.1 hypothetical protein K6T13_06205 [Nocardioides coralli]